MSRRAKEQPNWDEAFGQDAPRAKQKREAAPRRVWPKTWAEMTPEERQAALVELGARRRKP